MFAPFSPVLRKALTLVMTAGLAGLAINSVADASSHREAPAITEMPKLDSTDFYMFNSYEQGRDDYVTFIANYQPFQTAYGGPNFFQMDPDALYQIHIDNTGDAREDLTFTFRFKSALRDLALNIGGKMISVPLYNAAVIGPGVNDNAALNILETYTVDVTSGDQYSGRRQALTTIGGVRNIPKPADRVGDKSIPNYETYAQNHVFELNLPGITEKARVFVGQRKDPFVVNLGETFDLVNTNPLQAPDAKSDSLADDNCTSIILEVPKSYLKGSSDSIIGGWTSASLPRFRLLKKNPTFLDPTTDTGELIQVSRLANPLVNELVIGIKDKDKFGAARPRNDAQFLDYVTNPVLPAFLEAQFGVTAPCLPRTDLVAIFLTGLTGLNKPATVKPAEMMRLNLNTNPNDGGIAIKPRGQQDRLGVLGGDNQGYPNGRRPGDDVVDISLRAVMGAAIPSAGQPGTCAPSGALPYSDGAFIDSNVFADDFPYLNTPVASSPQ